MRTSEEYRKKADLRMENDSGVACMLRDAADLIDAVAWASHNGTLYPGSDALLSAYRASLRPAKPASGCEGCVHAMEPGGPNPNLIACLNCTRSTPRDNWEAKP